MSTGPRTEEGLARSRRARWIHGRYSQEARAAKIEAAERAEMEAHAEAYARQFIDKLLGAKGRYMRHFGTVKV
ncbi:MAG: hypothetical protein K1Y01_21860 [Vicinamibacteria bacterium]|nr:hypothetical protein [Vicinamibacteria bacterium]